MSPAHGKYAELLAQPGFNAHDQWQVKIQAQIQLHADVSAHSGGLTGDEIRRALLTPLNLPSELEALTTRYGSRVCALLNGSQVIPT